ncbi:hypothetical protein [Actinomadura sp. CNU-125]|uniref:hypothetical protein n=1 Tax=Actinomadura sp. CNU-125 TaxID=1904961 RepID=UPI0009F91B2D|nr:hypothetical protein [Actinomadura sp. CNU-125]
MFVGNPISGVTSAPEMLPEPWGAIGQLLPPGAAGTFIRSAVFFDGAGAAVPLAVLLGWAAAGFLLLGVAGLRAAKREPARDREPVPA